MFLDGCVLNHSCTCVEKKKERKKQLPFFAYQKERPQRGESWSALVRALHRVSAEKIEEYWASCEQMLTTFWNALCSMPWNLNSGGLPWCCGKKKLTAQERGGGSWWGGDSGQRTPPSVRHDLEAKIYAAHLGRRQQQRASPFFFPRSCQGGEESFNFSFFLFCMEGGGKGREEGGYKGAWPAMFFV